MHLNCPYCGFQFNIFMANSRDIPELVPIVCERCAQVSLLLERKDIMKPTEEQMGWIRQSPAWKLIIAPAIEIIKRKGMN